MTTATAKPTPGPMAVYHMPAMTESEDVQIFQLESPKLTGRFDEGDANAALIAEAFNVLGDTGLTPRQLADQRKDAMFYCGQLEAKLQAAEQQRAELLAALEGILSIGKRDMSNPKYDGFFDTASAAIANAKVQQ